MASFENDKLCANLLMVLGCLHDIREKCRDKPAARQLTDVEDAILTLCQNNFPETMIKISQ